MASIAVDEADLRGLLHEREELRRQVRDLQADATAKLEAGLPRRVRAFHVKFGHPVNSTPAVPDEPQLRFRLALIAEEFTELLEACVDTASPERSKWEQLAQAATIGIREVIAGAPIRVDFPAFIDALVDLAFVIEGTHAVAGTQSAPYLGEVFRANMSKSPAFVREKDGYHAHGHVKPLKPADWTPPDIVGVLRLQGWRP